MLTTDAWASVTVLANNLIDQMKLLHPGADIQYHDWDAGINEAELPECDLVGPTALSVSEYDPEHVEINFAIGYSTYTNDTSLFRLRSFGGVVFEALRPQRHFDFYNSDLALQESRVIITPGTLLAPMTRMTARPWQYVQAAGLLVPTGG